MWGKLFIDVATIRQSSRQKLSTSQSRFAINKVRKPKLFHLCLLALFRVHLSRHRATRQQTQ